MQEPMGGSNSEEYRFYKSVPNFLALSHLKVFENWIHILKTCTGKKILFLFSTGTVYVSCICMSSQCSLGDQM